MVNVTPPPLSSSKIAVQSRGPFILKRPSTQAGAPLQLSKTEPGAGVAVNPYVERLIGSMRRECVDHVMVLNERSLQRILRSYIEYYQYWRTHLALGKDPPVRRAVEPAAPDQVIARPHVGGLHCGTGEV